MKYLRIKIKTNKYIIIIIIVIVMFLSKIFQLYFLPDKYNNDSRTIIKFIQGEYDKTLDSSFYFAAQFFKPFYRIGINSVEKLSVFLGVVGNVFLLFFIKKRIDYYNLFNLIFLCVYISLLNIFIFMPMKEFIQLLVYFVMYYIICSEGRYFSTIVKKDIFIIILLLWEAYSFRTYYLLIAVVFCIISIIKDKFGLLNVKQVLFGVIFSFIGVFAGLSVLKWVYPSGYNLLSTIRYELTYFRVGSSDAQSLIIDLFANNSAFFFSLNIFVNFIRLVFPIELLMHGKAIYFLFFLAQLVFLILLLYVRGNAIEYNTRYHILYSYLLAYLLVSSLYEPDFGSVIRHIAALFPILCSGLPNSMEVLNENHKRIKFKL